MTANEHSLRLHKSRLFQGLDLDLAHQETMAIVEDIDQFSAILASMRESKVGKIVGLQAAFADIL